MMLIVIIVFALIFVSYCVEKGWVRMPEITDLNQVEKIKNFLIHVYNLSEEEAYSQARKIEKMNVDLESGNYEDSAYGK